MRVRSPRDFAAGLGFVCFGAAAAGIALASYEMGTSVRMGPAYFPVVLGAVLVLLGVLVLARSVAVEGPKINALRLRPVLAVLAACIVYAYTVRPFGIVVATCALVVTSSLARRWIGWRRVLALAIVLSAFAVGVFVEGLGMPLPVWPGLFG